jgi:hypothetical protein
MTDKKPDNDFERMWERLSSRDSRTIAAAFIAAGKLLPLMISCYIAF